MSGEQRVTDLELEIFNSMPTDPLQIEDRLGIDLRDERTAHRATEAKLTAALAEVERLTLRHNYLTTKHGDAWSALARIRGTIDRLGPVGCLPLYEAGTSARDEGAALSAGIEKIATTAESALAATKAKLEAAEKVLREAEETLRLVERPAFPDPVHHERVKALGREIGFGALMSTASAGWREVVEEKCWPGGGEFVAGPCLATVQATLKTIRAALTTKEAPDASR